MKRWVVFVENGFTRLMSPNGEVFRDEIQGVLVSPPEEGEAVYEASFSVDVVGSKEEALEKIKK